MLGGEFIGLAIGYDLHVAAQHSGKLYNTHYGHILELIKNANMYFYLDGVLLLWCKHSIIYDFQFPDVTKDMNLPAQRPHDLFVMTCLD